MRKIKNTLAGLILLVSLTNFTHAQDVHFSQMGYSPLTLNPALAGANSPLNAIVNYRNQWKSVASPYQTIAASFDARLNERKRRKKGILALGVNFFNDNAGSAKISSTNGSLNLAYHIILNNKSTLGGGIYGGFGQRSIATADGRWESQFDGMVYNPMIASGESFMTDRFTYFDVGSGLVYTYKNSERYMTSNNQREVNAGLAVYHLNKPNYSFLSANEEQLYMRFSFFVNAIIGIENTKMSIMPAIYYQRQKTAQELLFGTYFRYMIQEESHITGFNKGTFLSLGAFYRNKDALIVKGMLEFSDYSLGVAYDVNVSSLINVSNTHGGFELFLKYSLTRALAGKRARF